MVGKAKSHTKDDKRRFGLLQEVGCLPCRMKGLGHQPVDIHHLIEGSRRLGHQFTIGLCCYHHRGYEPGVSDKVVEEHKGPSLAKNKRAFYEEFGSERELLEATNEALMIIEDSFV